MLPSPMTFFSHYTKATHFNAHALDIAILQNYSNSEILIFTTDCSSPKVPHSYACVQMHTYTYTHLQQFFNFEF